MSPAPLALCVLALPLAALAAPPGAVAELRDGLGNPVGRAVFKAYARGVRMTVQVRGLPPGRHGFHVHAAGACEAPEFKSAGGHFNPTGKKHGFKSPEGHHAGDLPNLLVGRKGRGKASANLRGVTLGQGPGSLFQDGGTAVVIHADPDDGRTDPSGNSGTRIACGVVTRP